MKPLSARRNLTLITAIGLVSAGLLAPADASTGATAPTTSVHQPAFAHTSAEEAARVDRVDVDLRWEKCPVGGRRARCATIRVPLDYDQPQGRQIRVSMAKWPATDQQHKLGTLFVNPGGPGAAAADLALEARRFFSPAVLRRYDIVGVDPRGLGRGTQVRCFRSQKAKDAAYPVPTIAFPVSRAEERESLAASRRFVKACSTYGRPMTASSSTAEVARDLDVVRRAIGESHLDYLGLSYGSQLGQVYANLFPDRVGRMIIDGVLDPVAWTTGRGDSGRTVPIWDRLRVADGAGDAWSRFLELCDAAASACDFAATDQDPRTAAERFAVLVERLHEHPVTVDDPDIGPTPYSDRDLESYALTVLSSMGDPSIGGLVGSFLQQLWQLSEDSSASGRPALAQRAGLLRARTLDAADAATPGAEASASHAAARSAVPYGNFDDVFATVACSDSVEPRRQSAWRSAADAADARVPYFGRQLVWNGIACPSDEWRAHDEDRYLGPFDRRTRSTILVVGNYWDPQTSYRYGAVAAARTLGNARLLSSDSWGHTAYGTSTCMTRATDAYLIHGRLPATGTVCTGSQPFEGSGG